MLRMSELIYWITERERMRLLREGGVKAPWSQDEIMNNTRFCNVRREDDKVTRWVRQNWSGWAHHKNYTLAMALARYINWIPSLEKIPFPEQWDPENLKRNLHEWMQQGHQVFGPAYIISTNGRAMSKIDYVVDEVLDQLNTHAQTAPWENRQIRIMCSLEEACGWLLKQNGIGSFMAGQIIADLKNTVGHPLTNAPDWFTWCAPGPGSKRGLNRLYGLDKDAPLRDSLFLARIWALYDPLNGALEQNMFPIGLHMQDIQNCLCEFDKYIRVKEGGRAKSSYRAGKN